MAFPTIVSVATTSIATPATSFTVNLPGTYASGDDLFIVVSTDSTATCTMSTSGWTKVEQVTATDSTTLFHKVSDGSEGSTVTVASSISEALTAISVAVNGAASFEADVASTGSTTFHRVSLLTPDPTVYTETLALVFTSASGTVAYTTGEAYELSATSVVGDGTSDMPTTFFHGRHAVLKNDVWFDGGIAVNGSSAGGRSVVILCYGDAISGGSRSAVNSFSRVQSF